ncbi:MAG: acyl carrier protein [Oscillospiraceae bacterium]|nr:acyl carrier protein [Oscillospiraceae bacterium]
MVFEKLKEIILDQMDVDEEDITLDADIQEDLHADSLDIVMLMKTISDEFEMAVPDDAVDTIRTVGDIVDYIEEYQ